MEHIIKGFSQIIQYSIPISVIIRPHMKSVGVWIPIFFLPKTLSTKLDEIYFIGNGTKKCEVEFTNQQKEGILSELFLKCDSETDMIKWRLKI